MQNNDFWSVAGHASSVTKYRFEMYGWTILTLIGATVMFTYSDFIDETFGRDTSIRLQTSLVIVFAIMLVFTLRPMPNPTEQNKTNTGM
jgi:hypothetical protein